MGASIPSFRGLYMMDLRDYQHDPEHEHVYEDVLLPWQAQALEAISVLQVYGTPAARNWPREQPDPCNDGDRQYYTCLEHLYAFSRISDVLLFPQQQVWDYVHPPLPRWTPDSAAQHKEWMRGVDIPQWIPPISLEERNEWLRSLGLTEIEQPTFYLFYHEIVGVEQAPDHKTVPTSRFATASSLPRITQTMPLGSNLSPLSREERG